MLFAITRSSRSHGAVEFCGLHVARHRISLPALDVGFYTTTRDILPCGRAGAGCVRMPIGRAYAQDDAKNAAVTSLLRETHLSVATTEPPCWWRTDTAPLATACAGWRAHRASARRCPEQIREGGYALRAVVGGGSRNAGQRHVAAPPSA